MTAALKILCHAVLSWQLVCHDVHRPTGLSPVVSLLGVAVALCNTYWLVVTVNLNKTDEWNQKKTTTTSPPPPPITAPVWGKNLDLAGFNTCKLKMDHKQIQVAQRRSLSSRRGTTMR